MKPNPSTRPAALPPPVKPAAAKRPAKKPAPATTAPVNGAPTRKARAPRTPRTPAVTGLALTEAQTEAQIFDEVVQADLEHAQPLIARHLEMLEPSRKDSALALFLQSYWRHLEGMRVMREEGRFDRALELHQTAAEAFKQLGLGELESTARALASYSDAVLEVQRQNFNRGLELFGSIEVYLQQAGPFASRFKPLIDHMKPEALFLGVMPAAMAGDMAKAGMFATQAAAASRSVAANYYPPGSSGAFTFLGLGELYLAFLDHQRTTIGLNLLDLDELLAKDIAATAREAERLLAQGDLSNAQIRGAHFLAKALVELQEVSRGIAMRMKSGFEASLKPDPEGLRELRRKTERGADCARSAGPLAVGMVRACDRMLQGIANLEKLTPGTRRHAQPGGDKIFIVHGHDEAKWRELRELLEDQLGQEAVILKEEPGAASTLIQKFEALADQCRYAFVLMTPDDFVKKGGQSYLQARPNVIFEIGWFFGRYGPDRVCIVKKAGTTLPSDLAGIMSIDFHEDVREGRHKIEAELQRVGILASPRTRARPKVRPRARPPAA